MKTAWLLLYLWHQSENGHASSGGPSLIVAAMPSLQVCEIVGATAKQFGDTVPNLRGRGDFVAAPAAYRCVEVDSSQPPPDETELTRLRGGR